MSSLTQKGNISDFVLWTLKGVLYLVELLIYSQCVRGWKTTVIFRLDRLGRPGQSAGWPESLSVSASRYSRSFHPVWKIWKFLSPISFKLMFVGEFPLCSLSHHHCKQFPKRTFVQGVFITTKWARNNIPLRSGIEKELKSRKNA